MSEIIVMSHIIEMSESIKMSGFVLVVSRWLVGCLRRVPRVFLPQQTMFPGHHIPMTASFHVTFQKERKKLSNTVESHLYEFISEQSYLIAW